MLFQKRVIAQSEQQIKGKGVSINGMRQSVLQIFKEWVRFRPQS